MILSDIAEYVTEKVNSDKITLNQYVTTDSLLQNKRGRQTAQNLPSMPCVLTSYSQGDILISNIRPYLKKIWFADSNGGCSTDVLVFRAKKGHSSNFLFALLMQDAFFSYMMQGSKGSKMPRGDKNQIMHYKVPTFSSFEEENIGNIIVNIERKIALNRQINDNLEAMAKQLYDYWFVQFDFPDENGKPYKSNGGKMVWNECMKKSIPADWKTSLLSEWIDYSLERVSTSVVSDGDYYTPIEVIPRNKMSLSTTLPVENAVSGLCRYKKKDILLSNRRVYFHKICLAPFDGLTRDTVMVLRPKHEENLGYIYETMFSDSFISYATKVSYGSLQPVLSWTEAQKYHVLTPAKNLSEKYGKLINGIIEKVLSSQMEIIQLTKQRDELLPLLMNGQATVNYHLKALPFYRSCQNVSERSPHIL